jgi:translation initiation factor 3 subunit C
LARHHRYLLAKDILKASGIAKDQGIQDAEILTQILYNRTIARLAVAAFAQEDYSTAMTTLQKVYVTGKIKELLAQ